MIKAIVILALLCLSTASIYDKYYAQAVKITQAMTLDQKIGQTAAVDFNGITSKNSTSPDEALAGNFGSLFVSATGAPTASGNMANIPNFLEDEKIVTTYQGATLQNWQTLIKKFKDIGPQVKTSDNITYKIKMLLGTDAVHGDQHTVGTVLFPHNIGLSCSHNPTNFYNMGYWTADSLKKTGFNHAYAPTVAVTHNPQWGRYYESMGQEDNYVYLYAKEFIRGLQNASTTTSQIYGVLGTAKHFIGDGSTIYGANQGNARVHSFKTYLSHNSQGYKGAIESEVGSIMASYSAINDIPMSISSLFLQNYLRQDLGFGGLVISDYDVYNYITDNSLPTSFVNVTVERAVGLMLNNGVNMIMIDGKRGDFDIEYKQYFKHVKKTLEDTSVFLNRLDESVTKIIQVKLAMGLVETVKGTDDNIEETVQEKRELGVTSAYGDALQAVHQSLVLLKNENKTIPAVGLTSNIKFVVLVGQRILNINRLTKLQLFRSFDNIGMQSGGWSVRWQGFMGNDFWKDTLKEQSNASSLLDALKLLQKRNNFTLLYPNYTTFSDQVIIDAERNTYLNELKNYKKNMTVRNTLIIGALGEVPYAESEGDRNIPYCLNLVDDPLGCLYDSNLNPYIPSTQAKTLQLDYETFDTNVINSIREVDKSIPLVTVLFSGRPMLVDSALNISSAFIAAWLPGTAGGQGVIDAIAGDYKLRPNGDADKTNTLSMDWPANMDSLKAFPVYDPDGSIPNIANPLFKVGYGLSSVVSSEPVPPRRTIFKMHGK